MDDFFPGSKRKRREPRPVPEKKRSWDAEPRFYEVNGEKVEFFTIGALAEVLDKKPVTLRTWIRHGKLPEARFKLPPRGKATFGEQGGQRLWTRAQIEAIAVIAAEEGVLGVKPKDFAKTKFTERVIEVMKK
jgi:hypothetical protein